jgi:hypothetical protein
MVADLEKEIDQMFPSDAAAATAVNEQYAAASDAEANDTCVRITLLRTTTNQGSKSIYMPTVSSARQS